FPFNNFIYYLTFFLKCFLFFNYSTCALLVSSQYLALKEIYFLFKAAFLNNLTY
ncbi:uncharacterized protein K460DRAFT_297690, partial [Cucurbitaria berberidis CBS 394.84]